MLGSDDVDVVHGSGNVARRGVEGRGTGHAGVEMARDMEAGRGFMLDTNARLVDGYMCVYIGAVWC